MFFCLWLPYTLCSVVRWPQFTISFSSPFTSQLFVASQPAVIARDAVSKKNKIKNCFFIKGTDLIKQAKNEAVDRLFGLHPAIVSWRTYITTVDAHLEQRLATLVQRRSMVVRVLLSSCAVTTLCTWKFRSDKGLYLSFFDAHNTVEPKKIFCREKIAIHMIDGHIVCRGKKDMLSMMVLPMMENFVLFPTSILLCVLIMLI
jgi:hypothetical protein